MDEFDWGALVASVVHPTKVAIIEAMRWIGEPLSATECAALFNTPNNSLGVVFHHMSALAEAGWIEVDAERQARGARETFYYLVKK